MFLILFICFEEKLPRCRFRALSFVNFTLISPEGAAKICDVTLFVFCNNFTSNKPSSTLAPNLEKLSTTAAAHGQTRSPSQKSSDTSSSHTSNLPQPKLDAVNPPPSNSCLLKPKNRFSSSSSTNCLTDHRENCQDTPTRGLLQDST